MEDKWMWAFAIVLAAYAFSAFSEVTWALWVALVAALPMMFMMSSDMTAGL